MIRESMLSRGWCEKFYKKPASNGEKTCVKKTRGSLSRWVFFAGDRNTIGSNLEASPVALLAGIGDLKDPQSERLLISRMLADNTVDFLWNSGSEWAGWPARDNATTIFNRYCRAGFTSKIGLCSNVRQMYWYYEPDVANTLFPRCYNVCQSDQMHAFVEDFRCLKTNTNFCTIFFFFFFYSQSSPTFFLYLKVHSLSESAQMAGRNDQRRG